MVSSVSSNYIVINGNYNQVTINNKKKIDQADMVCTQTRICFRK